MTVIKTYKVTYYYLATGMEGNADIRDMGLVKAKSAEEARLIIASKSDYREWMMSCLSAEEVKDA